MRYELRLLAAALFILVLIALSCRCEAIAEVRRGLDGPPAERCERVAHCDPVERRDPKYGDNLKYRGKERHRVAATSGGARQ